MNMLIRPASDRPERADLPGDLAAERVERPAARPSRRGGVALHRWRRRRWSSAWCRRRAPSTLSAWTSRGSAPDAPPRAHSQRSRRRRAGRDAACPVIETAVIGPPLGRYVPVVPQEQLLQRRRLAGQADRMPVRSAPQHRVELVGVHLEPDPVSRRPPGRARRAARPTGRRPRQFGLRSRCGSGGAARPACRSRRSAPCRMMLTRSQSASTSARMWLDSSTVRSLSPLLLHALAGTPPPSAGPGRRSARPGSAVRRRRRARRPARPSAGCPSSRCGPSCVGSSSNRSSSSARRRCRGRRAAGRAGR